MITDQDVTKLKKVFATKAELKGLENRFDHLECRFDSLQEQVGELKVEMGELSDKMDHVLVSIDSIVGTVKSLQVENGACDARHSRSSRQIRSIAEYIDFELPD